MKIVAVNYANDAYAKTQKLNTKTARKKGKVEKVYAYSPKDIDSDFYEKNKEIFQAPRGNGYWIWKPYFLKKTLECLEDGDYMMYADAGGFYYKKPVSRLVEIMEREDMWLLHQDVDFLEKEYTKRDAFVYMECDTPEYTDTNQRMGGLHIIKKCREAEKFLEEWLAYACDKRIISDDENVCGLPNYEGFQAHRNDQSIFSLLCKKYKIEPFENIRQEGKYKTVFYHHTKCGHPLTVRIYIFLVDSGLLEYTYKKYCRLKRKV